MTTFLPALLFGLLLQGQPPLTAHVPGQRQVEQALGKIGEGRDQVPRFDRKLDAAAALLARQILETSADAPLRPFSGDALQAALAEAGAFDPAPSAVVLRARTPQALASSMAAHPELRRQRATHFGISILAAPGRAAGVLLLVERRAELNAFPRQAKVGAPCRVAGRFLKPLRAPQVALTDPQGQVHAWAGRADGAGNFEIDLAFQQPGVHTFELLAEGRYGTEVVALFPVEVMGARGAQAARGGKHSAVAVRQRAEPERADMARAERQVLEAINLLRHEHGRLPLARDARLDALARHHARQMGALGFFGHRSPSEGNVGERLEAAGIGYRVVAENLAEAHSALDAHWLLEKSPGHRKNLLMPEVTRVGIGTAPVPGRPGNLYLVQIFVQL